MVKIKTEGKINVDIKSGTILKRNKMYYMVLWRSAYIFTFVNISSNSVVFNEIKLDELEKYIQDNDFIYVDEKLNLEVYKNE